MLMMPNSYMAMQLKVKVQRISLLKYKLFSQCAQGIFFFLSKTHLSLGSVILLIKLPDKDVQVKLGGIKNYLLVLFH